MVRFVITILIFTFLVMVSFSCSNAQQPADIDSFINKYQHEDFEIFKGISVFQRSASVNEVVYGVGAFQQKLPIYFVSFNLITQKISEINDANIKKANIKSYLTEADIEKYISEIRKYGFYLIAVDDSSNLYVNPFKPNAPPLLLRLHTQTSLPTVRKGYVYDIYKGSWYVNRSR
jgi:hypothetical protein